ISADVFPSGGAAPISGRTWLIHLELRARLIGLSSMPSIHSILPNLAILRRYHPYFRQSLPELFNCPERQNRYYRHAESADFPFGGLALASVWQEEWKLTMLFARLKLCLATAVALAAIAGAKAASAQDWTPFGPSDVRYDLELFKQPDISAYANWPRPN